MKVLVIFFAESDRFSMLKHTVFHTRVTDTYTRSQIRLLHSLSCYLYIHVVISSTQMFPWCPHWCRHPTAAVWRSVLTDNLWIWTRPSTNTTTSAHTHAPCWTLSSDQSIIKTDPIRSSFRQWRWFPVYLLKLWPMGRCFRLECLKKKKLDQILWCSLEP